MYLKQCSTYNGYMKNIGFSGIVHSTAVLALLLLAGCAALPALVPDMAMQSSHPVRLDSAHGLLSTKQSKAVLARLGSHGAATDIFDRHLALETAIAGNPLVVGNSVTLLVDGPSTYDAMFAAIAHAQDHINMETYIFEDDQVGQQFAELLSASSVAACR